MSEVIRGVIDKSTAQAICDAVKEKEGSTEGVPFNTVADRIRALSVGGGENKLNQYFNKTLTEVTAADLEGVTSIKESAFKELPNLESVILPDSVTEVGGAAFSKCNALKTVKLSNGMTVIEGSLFYECKSLEGITLPCNLITIKNNSFSGCSALSELTVPVSLKNVAGYAFTNMSLDKVYYEGGLADWCKIVFEAATGNPTSCGVEFYYKNSAGEYEALLTLVIPDTVTEILPSAFYGCNNMTSLTVLDTVESVGKSAFSSCQNLASAAMNCAYIGGSCFAYCEKLTNITLGSNVSQIDSSALSVGKTSNKATFTFLGTTPPTISTSTFNKGCIKKIIVPKGCGEAYKAATNWANYADYIEEAAE